MEEKINLAIQKVDVYLDGLLSKLNLDKLDEQQKKQAKEMLAKSLEQYLLKVFLGKMSDAKVTELNQKLDGKMSLEQMIEFLSNNVENYDQVLLEAITGFENVLQESVKQV